MRAKSLLAVVLGIFVAAALIVVARQAMVTRPAAVDEPPSAPAAAARAIAPRTLHANRPVPEEPASTALAAAVPDPTPSLARQASVADTRIERPETSARPNVAPAVARPAHKVVAMYFHGNVRCATCRKVEAYAREAVEEGFPSQIAEGGVEFRAVNVEQPENRHFIDDYHLVNKSVVVVDEVGGAPERWVKLDNVWGLVGDHDAYLLYVQDAVRAYVEMR